jgi:hypothetical protein
MAVDDIAYLPHCGTTCLRQLIAALKDHATHTGDYGKLLSVLGTTPVHTLRLPNALVNRLGSIRVLTLKDLVQAHAHELCTVAPSKTADAMVVKALATGILSVRGNPPEPVRPAATSGGAIADRLLTGLKHGTGELELSSLGLSRRAYNALMRASIRAPAQLRAMSRAEILAIKGVGAQALDDIERALSCSNELPTTNGRPPGRTGRPDQPIRELDLQLLVRRRLTAAGITTVDQLLSMDRDSLLRIRGLGTTGAAEIGVALGQRYEAASWAQEEGRLGGPEGEATVGCSGAGPLTEGTQPLASVRETESHDRRASRKGNHRGTQSTDMGESVAHLGDSGLPRRAFAADEVDQLLGNVAARGGPESTLSANPNLISLGVDQQGRNWYVAKSQLFGWFCRLNRLLAAAEVFQLDGEQLAHAMGSLRIEEEWESPLQTAVAFGEALGLVGHAVKPGHYVFPLARVLALMPGLTRAAANGAFGHLASVRAWEIPLDKLTGDYVRAGFVGCGQRERAIVLRRTGVHTGTRMTLEEAGSPWGLSRERTRQLENRFWTRLNAHAGVGRQRRQSLVTAMLCDLLAHQGSLVVPVGPGTTQVRVFLARCARLPVTKLRELGLLVLAATGDGLRALESRRPSPDELTDEAIAQRLAREGPPGMMARDTLALARAALEYRRKHLRTPERVYLALQAIGRPAHYSRIAEMHNSMFPQKATSEKSIHGCLSREQLGVVWIGARGTFALEEWGYERPSATLFESVADIVERKYEETGRPVPYSVVVAEIGKVRPIVNPTSLTYATTLNDRLQSVDGNCFVPRSGNESSTEEPSAEELDRILRRFQEDTHSLQSAAQESEAGYAGLDH